jgi:hypothetical protein
MLSSAARPSSMTGGFPMRPESQTGRQPQDQCEEVNEFPDELPQNGIMPRPHDLVGSKLS